jgi:transmembrane sensor
MTKEDIIALCDRIIEGKATEQDLIVYDQLYARMDSEEWSDVLMGSRDEVNVAIRIGIDEALRQQSAIRRVSLRRWAVAAAAAVLLVLAGAGWWWRRQPETPKVRQDMLAIGPDVKAPTGTHAVLTLANGRQIMLDSSAPGKLAGQSGAEVIKNAGGTITYTAKASGYEEVVYNSLYNPRGSQVIKLQLSDGTKVWVNSLSSLRYPVAFSGGNRTVEITGEAYFEVARDPRHPFIVRHQGLEVEVLGTGFNINTYEDEEMAAVTLIQGSVRVTQGKASEKLSPGEQVRIGRDGGINVMEDTDLGVVTAWKDGLFRFNGSRIGKVMREIGRWYDMDVEYAGPAPTDEFVGDISRQANVSGVLRILEQTKAVHFAIEGRKIIVSR